MKTTILPLTLLMAFFAGNTSAAVTGIEDVQSNEFCKEFDDPQSDIYLGKLKSLADNGDATSQNSLGTYYKACQQPADLKQAKLWFEKAANANLDMAQYNLGNIYFQNEENYPEAKKWFEKAANQGHRLAQTNLALIYLNGMDGAQDYNKAKQLFEKSALAGDAVAMANLGMLYYGGHGVKKDFKQANNWFKKACDGGYKDACGVKAE